MARQVWLLLLIGAGAVLAGCGGDSATVPASTGPATVGGSTTGTGSGPGGGPGGASTTGLGGSGGPGAFEELPGPTTEGLLGNLVVYFDFDQSDIQADFNEILAAHGEYLASNSGVQVRLEGHADETGSREYNIGLGERRAQAVRRVLLLQGAAAEQLSTMSFGEERPVAFGSDDESYALNRRVQLVYRR
ncbi:MAG: peptidoglycan-associated lipoprotein Pal [Candidatus Rariloculaceae bacterium]